MSPPAQNFLLELFSEEIPARMQAGGADTLARLIEGALAPLAIRDIATFSGPRRIALAATLDAAVPAGTGEARGPREGAPAQALDGFLRRHGAERASLRLRDGVWWLATQRDAVAAAVLIEGALPGLLRRFAWPKSMRWGAGSSFTWVRPLRRILCILDGAPVRFSLADGEDDGHRLVGDAVTEGHRFLSPGLLTARSVAGWQRDLRAAHVLVSAGDRATLIREGLAGVAREAGLELARDDGLIAEVAGLVEWPVPLLGRIDAAFMDLPAEVMQVSMRVHQRYFALRRPDGTPASHFAFIAGSIAGDGGALTIAGNERVLRARFSDARHFWDLDRATPLAVRARSLDGVTFHAALGSQAGRVSRIERLAALIAPLVGADAEQATRAAQLAKADLLTGMVGEFPELQGVMGEYYARHDGEPDAVARAIREHYLPRSAADATPREPVSIALALADRLDSLAAFFAAGEKPGGSGDPYALRRAALGVIRIIRDNGLRLDLFALLEAAGQLLPETLRTAPDLAALPGFITERLRVQLRADGARHDVLAAVNAAGADGDLTRLLARTEAVAQMLETEAGHDLLAAARRAANILRIEEARDGAHDATPDPALYQQEEERALASALRSADPAIRSAMAREHYTEAMTAMAALRETLDRFFSAVMVNVEDPAVRRNRLCLLAALRATFGRVADFTAIES